MYRSHLNAELCRQFSQDTSTSGVSLANLAHTLFGQPGLRVVFAVLIYATIMIVSNVFIAGAPGQIVETTIGLDAVQMAALHSVRARTDESFQDETVNPEGSITGVVSKRQVDVNVSVFVGGKFLSLPAVGEAARRPSAPYTPIVPDPVSGETRNVTILNRICRSHDLNLLEGLVVVRAGRQVATAGSARFILVNKEGDSQCPIL